MKRKTFGKLILLGVIVCFLGYIGVLYAAKSGSYAVTQGAKSYYNIYDEDTMSTDAQYGLASQQSIKAYADGANRTITGTRSHSASIYRSGTSPTATTKIGYVIAGTEGDFYLIGAQPQINVDECEYGVGPVDGAGVTVVLPTPTEALHGWEPTFVKHDSGATDIFLRISGTSETHLMDSGTTDGNTDSGTYALDAQWDSITLQCYWLDAGTSGYIIRSRGIDGSNK